MGGCVATRKAREVSRLVWLPRVGRHQTRCSGATMLSFDKGSRMDRKLYLYEHCSWPELGALAKKQPVIVLPGGPYRSKVGINTHRHFLVRLYRCHSLGVEFRFSSRRALFVRSWRGRMLSQSHQGVCGVATSERPGSSSGNHVDECAIRRSIRSLFRFFNVPTLLLAESLCHRTRELVFATCWWILS